MLENLGDKLQKIIKDVRGLGIITESNIEPIMREIRLSLLAADVNYTIVKEFTNSVREKALGEEVKSSLKPGELFVKIIHDEIVKLLGEEYTPLNITNLLDVCLMTGLQGAGKTTTVGKLANLIRKKHKKKILLVAADVYRPGAKDQLKQIGKQLKIEVFSEDNSNKPVEIAENALKYAKEKDFNYIIIDTAGRLQIDETLMTELVQINEKVNANEIILVLDSMMGQEAINVIKKFNETLPLTGSILTKLDGDTRGGVALSLKYLTNVPIKFIGISEKMDGIMEFHPNRMADRILGMGDVVSLVEKVQDTIDEKEAINAYNKMKQGKFDLEDFLKQMNQIKKLGPLENVIKMIPGASKLGPINIDKKQMAHIEAIVLSMTPRERRNPHIIESRRKKRIATGCGLQVSDVNRLLKQFEQMKKMMKHFKSGNFKMPF
ncbi:MAG: signal recognition particle protein [Bacilli bacterium]